MNITRTGDKVFITFAVQERRLAETFEDGRIREVTLATLEIDQKPNSWMRDRNPDIKFGIVETVGAGVITLDVADLIGLAYRAAKNKNKTARQGIGSAKFSGRREFRSEEQ